MQFVEYLKAYSIRYPAHAEISAEFIDFMESENEFAFKRENLKRHFTASAWILSPNLKECLLTHHRKLNRWLQLGGHCDGDTDILKSALREAEEESGIQGFRLLENGIFDIDRHLLPARPNEPEHFHYDVRFCIVAPHQNFKVSNESNDLKWFSIEDSIFNTGCENSILRMHSKWKNFVDEIS